MRCPSKLQFAGAFWECRKLGRRLCRCSDVPPSTHPGPPFTIGNEAAIELPPELRLDQQSILIGGLTAWQQEVMGLVVLGKTDWEIGRILGISPKTVNFHVETAKRKLNATTRSQAVATLTILARM